MNIDQIQTFASLINFKYLYELIDNVNTQLKNKELSQSQLI